MEHLQREGIETESVAKQLARALTIKRLVLLWDADFPTRSSGCRSDMNCVQAADLSADQVLVFLVQHGRSSSEHPTACPMATREASRV